MKVFVGIALGLLLVFSLLFLWAEHQGWMRAEYVTGLFENLRAAPGGPILAGLAIALLLAADLILPVPSSVLMTLAGALLGLHAGWAASLAGAMGSAVLGFGLCRRFGRPAFERVAGSADTARIERFFDRYGVWAILLSRAVPMLTEIMSCLAGLSRLRFAAFVALSLAGTWPVCFVYAWAGSRAGVASAAAWTLLLAFALPAAGFAALRLTGLAPGPRPANRQRGSGHGAG